MAIRDKELRFALICYGGISLAVYMHGITKEIWHLVEASRRFNRRQPGSDDATGGDAAGKPLSPYDQLLRHVLDKGLVRLRVLADIVAGASAGGINGIFLSQAIATGQSLDPITDLWLDMADVERLIDPEARPVWRFNKWWASPVAWLALRKPGGTIDQSVEPETRAEVRRKLTGFVRARWFQPPFGGAIFTGFLLDALDAMAATGGGGRLLPEGHPLDLFLTVTDFHGHPEWLKLSGSTIVQENEHRLVIEFADHGSASRRTREIGSGGAAPPGVWASRQSLAFAARATASFPGAFPPFTLAEMDGVIAARDQQWPDRGQFLDRITPGGIAAADRLILIDGAVLVNAPFRPAIQALRDRPARREIDRRFVYIDPKPGMPHIGALPDGKAGVPGFFATLFGAMSDIPREQPIRDNLEAIEARSRRIRRMQHILDHIRPEVESAIADHFGGTFFFDRPTPQRLRTWRNKAQDVAARRAGFAYPSYGHLKLSQIVESLAQRIAVRPGPAQEDGEAVRRALWRAVRAAGVDTAASISTDGASPGAIAFFRDHDLGFRIRRLRMLNRKAAELAAETPPGDDRNRVQQMRDTLYDVLACYLDRERSDFLAGIDPVLASVIVEPQAALDAVSAAYDLRTLDDHADARIADVLGTVPKSARRDMLLTYLGFPFYDIATLPLLQDSDGDEFDPIRVDRISPRDAQFLRQGGPEATLKGIQFNSFGAFFSRAYRENDYLWGRLHGAERMIDIVLSVEMEAAALIPADIARLKRDILRAILEEERPRLPLVRPLIDSLITELAGKSDTDQPATGPSAF